MKDKIDRLVELYKQNKVQQIKQINPQQEKEDRYELELTNRINRLVQYKKNLQQAKKARQRFQQKPKLPTNNIQQNRPVYEEIDLVEDLNKAINLFRQNYYSGKMMRFRDWCSVMEKILDDLD